MGPIWVKQRTLWNLFLLILLCSFLDVLGVQMLEEKSHARWPKEITVRSDAFRAQQFPENDLPKLFTFAKPEEEEKRAKAAAAIFLEYHCAGKGSGRGKKTEISQLIEKWEQFPQWKSFLKQMDSIWADVQYFPILQRTGEKESVTFENSWMEERTFGGKRGHEGTDLMTAFDEPGRYPAVSMTDGTVLHKGWLPKGGYRIGILSPHGGYFYYAHLDSYAEIEEGDTVQAGQLIGFVGNSGYGVEGTKGKFATHLHVGIYLNPGKEEISVNPYWILKYLEQRKLTYTSG